ncbi:MAG: pseudouridine-5-phosphate glycosidase, partial [Microbacteriaceae bacterium]|nr:pseudouridine-5-phosphate glycosidase [Microbacteriaceae bacterium]
VASIMSSRDSLGLRSGLIVANPVPADQQWDPITHDRILAQALHEAHEAGIRGHDVTPFLLAYIQHNSAGESLKVNLDLVTNNVAVALAIATAWTKR